MTVLTADMLYAHVQIQGVLDKSKPFNPFFLQQFGHEHFSETDSIIFEEVSADERIAPFVRPMAQAEAATNRGHTAMVFKPAYMKPKDVIMPKQLTSRRVGESFGGSMSPKQRYAAEMLRLAAAQRDRIFRAKEVMGRDLFRYGKYTVEGDNYPLTEVDFQRKAAHSGAVATADQWNKVEADSNPSSPVDQLEEWLLGMEKPTRRILIGQQAAKWLKKDPKLKERMDTRYRGNATDMNMDFAQMNDDQTIVLGYLGAMRTPVVVTTATFEREKRTTTGVTFERELYVAPNEIYLLPSAEYGHRCYGIIQDAHAEYRAMSHFFRNWLAEDPAVPQLMTQSAPLLVHTYIDATLCKQVCPLT